MKKCILDGVHKINGDDLMDNILSVGLCIIIVACLVEISAIHFSGFKKDIRIKVNQ